MRYRVSTELHPASHMKCYILHWFHKKFTSLATRGKNRWKESLWKKVVGHFLFFIIIDVGCIMPSKNEIELKILRKQCPAPTCSRNQYSLSTPDLHTARPPNNFRPQHKSQNDRRTKHPEFRNSGRVFERLLILILIWNVPGILNFEIRAGFLRGY